MRLSLAVAVCFLPFVVRSQSAPSEPPSAVIRIETTQLRSSAVGKITEIPLPVDMNLAKQFVTAWIWAHGLRRDGLSIDPVSHSRFEYASGIGVGAIGAGVRAFQGSSSWRNGIQRFAGRVSGVAFGRELSPVLYVHLPYWTHQREGPNTKGIGTKISDKENEQLVAELKRVFVDELEAEEFGPDTINSRVIRIWWHH